MFCYKRKTSFISYYINGIKSRSIGVVKQCLTQDGLNISVDLFGLEDWKSMDCRVSVGDAKVRQPVFVMEVRQGKGKGECSLSAEILRKINPSKIFFSLGSDCYGIADLCEVTTPVTDAYSENLYIKDVNTEDVHAENLYIKDINTEDVHSENLYVEEVNAESTHVGSKDSGERCAENEYKEKDEESELIHDCLEPQPDKWEVIKKKYPILYPFKGQGPYVSIKPVDLQLLDSKYHHLSNNSFLMHNFYQYKHLILGEYAWEKGTFFYVGVPGEFIKKEQNTAAVFGFEGYEHSGDLGYYLYRVAL